MTTENPAENVMFVALPPEPRACDELKAINETVSIKCDSDVIVDFTQIEILISPSISNLILLHNWLHGAGHRLILCNLGFATRCIFKTVGLDCFFEFADSRADALAALEHAQLQSI
jgi:anti-anti-sigma regulatory factor